MCRVQVIGSADHQASSLRKDTVSVVETYQYSDPEDVFSRDPFVVKFSTPSCGEIGSILPGVPVLKATP